MQAPERPGDLHMDSTEVPIVENPKARGNADGETVEITRMVQAVSLAPGSRRRRRGRWKLTWLYYVGDLEPIELRWNRPEPTAIVSNCANHFVRDLPRILKAEAARTPAAFRDDLLRLVAA